jgi:hypothetical protein
MYLWLVFFVGFLVGGIAVNWTMRKGLSWRHRGAQSESYPALRATVVAHLQSYGTLNIRQFETLTEVTGTTALQHLSAMESEGLIVLHRRNGQRGGFYTLA